jgi:DNA-binding transcriptional regulator YiaG
MRPRWMQNDFMPNIANVLKAEITRLARKEVREDSTSLKKTVSAQRTDIAGLKRRLQELEKAVKQLAKVSARATPARPSTTTAETDKGEAEGLRFSAKGMATNRKRLKLSAADFGLLIGASGQSIYAWETGKSKPRAESLNAIAGLRGLGLREVTQRLSELKQQ